MKNTLSQVKSFFTLIECLIKKYWKIFDSENPDHWIKSFTFFWVLFWLLVCFYKLTFSESEPLNLNSWGDFFAGIFAPLAFLWLVRGYYQQSKELKQNTEALKLQEKALLKQAQELEASVTQQKELVSLAQVEHKLAIEREQRELYSQKNASKPIFNLERFFAGLSDGSHFDPANMTLINCGETIKNVSFRTIPGFKNFTLTKNTYPQWEQNAKLSLKLGNANFDSWDNPNKIFSIIIEYIDALGDIERANLIFKYKSKHEGVDLIYTRYKHEKLNEDHHENNSSTSADSD